LSLLSLYYIFFTSRIKTFLITLMKTMAVLILFPCCSPVFLLLLLQFCLGFLCFLWCSCSGFFCSVLPCVIFQCLRSSFFFCVSSWSLLLLRVFLYSLFFLNFRWIPFIGPQWLVVPQHVSSSLEGGWVLLGC